MINKLFTKSVSAFIISLSLSANAEPEPEPDPEQDKIMCKYAADHMIQVAKESLGADKNSRPERTEKRRKLAEEWSSRMEAGEDPCKVYEDIQKAANTF